LLNTNEPADSRDRIRLGRGAFTDADPMFDNRWRADRNTTIAK